MLQKLSDPGQEKGLQRRTSALDVYRTRNYKAALDAFDESKKYNIDHVLEEFGVAICECYSAWTDLNLPELHDKLGRLSLFAREAAMVRLFEQRSFDQAQLELHLAALSAVAKNEKELDSKRVESSLPSRVGFIQGTALLCILSQLHRRFYGGKTPLSAIQMIREIAGLRNSSVLAHGNNTLTDVDSNRMLDIAEKLASAIMSAAELAQLDLLRRDLEPLPLGELQEVQ